MLRQTLVFLIISGLMLSQSTHAESDHGSEHHEQEHSFHSNFLGVFVGRTSETRREGSFTLGLEYNRRFTERFGMGVLAEHVFSDHEFNVYAVGFAHYRGPWKFYVAPGVEKGKHHDAEFLLRFGVEYAFRVGGLEIAPQIDLDLVDGDQILVFGLTFGKGF